MLKRLLNSFKFAIAGVNDLFSFTPNAKIHLAFAFLATFFGFYLKINATEWCLVIFAIGMVMAAEAFNTSIEYLTNLVTSDYHELAKKTKDVAAGGVFITAITAAIIGAIIYLPKLILIFQ